jgi:hypothetical protein
LLGGLIVIVAPFALGDLANHTGLSAAFAVEPVLIASSALLLYTGTRLLGSVRPAGRTAGDEIRQREQPPR